MAPLTSRGISPGRIRYLPNWAESFYKPGDSQAAAVPCAGPAVTRILFAGNIGAAQSFETILEAARLLKHRPDIHWVVAGDGLMRRWVTEQVRLSGLETTVTLLGRRPPAEMPSLYSRADALLVTLRRDPVFAMTIPAKIQSYLASGKLIVGALDGEGARTIRASGAGLVVDAQDAQGLAQCVQEIAAMSMAERDEMGRRGREYFEQYFSRDKLVGQLESWMHELAGT